MEAILQCTNTKTTICTPIVWTKTFDCLFNSRYKRSRFAWKGKMYLDIYCKDQIQCIPLNVCALSSCIMPSRALGLIHFPYIHLPSRIFLSVFLSLPSWPRKRDIPGLDLSVVWNSILSRNTSSPSSWTGLLDCLKASLLALVSVIYSAFFLSKLVYPNK